MLLRGSLLHPELAFGEHTLYWPRQILLLRTHQQLFVSRLLSFGFLASDVVHPHLNAPSVYLLAYPCFRVASDLPEVLAASDHLGI